jgi:hypothetical protein
LSVAVGLRVMEELVVVEVEVVVLEQQLVFLLQME